MVKEDPKAMDQKTSRTLKDDQIITERRLPRRSFLATAGTLLAGGAVAIVAGSRAAAQEPDSDAKPAKKDNDADKKKMTSKSAKSKKVKKAKKSEKDSDADKAKKKAEKDSDQ